MSTRMPASPPLPERFPRLHPTTRRMRPSPLAQIARASLGLAIAWIAAAALAAPPASAREGALTPAEVDARRVAGSIEDRVRIDLETAGGELAVAEIEVAATPDGHVTLSGQVPSSEAKARAEQRARWAVGVSEVDNRLAIVAPPAPPVTAAVGAGPDRGGPGAGSTAVDASDRPSDDALEERVARALANDLPIEARARHRWLRGWQVSGKGWSFEVDADDGRVRLDGRVSDRLEIDEVAERARAVPAVRSVEPSLERVDPNRKGLFDRLF